MRVSASLMGLSCLCYQALTGVAFSAPAFPSHLLGEWRLHVSPVANPDKTHQVASSIRLHVYPTNVEFRVGATQDSCITFRGALVNATTDASDPSTMCAFVNSIEIVGGLWALRHADLGMLANMKFADILHIWGQVAKNGIHVRVNPVRSFAAYRDYRAALALRLHEVAWESGAFRSSTPWVVRHASDCGADVDREARPAMDSARK